MVSLISFIYRLFILTYFTERYCVQDRKWFLFTCLLPLQIFVFSKIRKCCLSTKTYTVLWVWSLCIFSHCCRGAWCAKWKMIFNDLLALIANIYWINFNLCILNLLFDNHTADNVPINSKQYIIRCNWRHKENNKGKTRN